MMSGLSFDQIDAALTRRQRKRNLQAIENSIVNIDVAKRLAAGESVKEVAEDLGVSEQTVRKRMKKGALKDLIAIENRRVILHMSRRKLKDEKYLALATSVSNLVGAEKRLEDENMGPRSQTINIQELNLLFSERGRKEPCDYESEGIQELDAREVPSLPEHQDIAGEGSDSSRIPDGRED